MSDPYIGEIRIVGFNFAPRGWAICAGQLLPISQNTALFSLLGTMYGGDGRTTFALPKFQDIAPMQWGQGPGLSMQVQGEIGGEPSVTLIQSEMPAHVHIAQASGNGASTNDPTNGLWAVGGEVRGGVPLYNSQGPGSSMNVGALTPQGQSQPHNNMQPYLALNFIIALQGIFPPRS
jgi:microcystin-dependent protein